MVYSWPGEVVAGAMMLVTIRSGSAPAMLMGASSSRSLSVSTVSVTLLPLSVVTTKKLPLPKTPWGMTICWLVV